MHRNSFLYVTLVGALATACKATYLVDPSYKIDVHSHVIPDRWRTALADEGGYPVKDGRLYVDGYPVKDWNLTTHISVMDDYGTNYSTISISAPGVSFLAHDATRAATLAKEVNDDMASYVSQYPTRLGAMCLLPLPHIPETLTMIDYCLDKLDFDGIAMFTNANGTYLGDSNFNPVFEAINKRGNVTIFVHPTHPGCASVDLGYPDPAIEYPFDTVRAIENLLLTGQRDNYSDINIIFPHGGGAIPYLAQRIAGLATMPFAGSRPIADSLAQFKGYLLDTASAFTAIQLVAMKMFSGAEKIVFGTDQSYAPAEQVKPGIANFQKNGQFTDAELALINNQNALAVFPGIAAKLGFALVPNSTANSRRFYGT